MYFKFISAVDFQGTPVHYITVEKRNVVFLTNTVRFHNPDKLVSVPYSNIAYWSEDY